LQSARKLTPHRLAWEILRSERYQQFFYKPIIRIRTKQAYPLSRRIRFNGKTSAGFSPDPYYSLKNRYRPQVAVVESFRQKYNFQNGLIFLPLGIEQSYINMCRHPAMDDYPEISWQLDR
jgi:hypothetical protein